MNICPQNQDLLWLHLVGELEEDKASELNAHWLDCRACAEEAEQSRSILEEMKSISLQDPGDLFFQRQFRQIEEKIQNQSIKSPSIWRTQWVAVAAVLLLFLGFSTIYPQRNNIQDWNMALGYLAEPSNAMLEDPMLEVNLDELNSPQLDLLASNIERKLLWEMQNSDVFDQNDRWYDLSGDELDHLLKRLEQRSSRGNS